MLDAALVGRQDEVTFDQRETSWPQYRRVKGTRVTVNFHYSVSLEALATHQTYKR